MMVGYNLSSTRLQRQWLYDVVAFAVGEAADFVVEGEDFVLVGAAKSDP
jgi:hypothetical protein